jgi:hypothetical protein
MSPGCERRIAVTKAIRLVEAYGCMSVVPSGRRPPSYVLVSVIAARDKGGVAVPVSYSHDDWRSWHAAACSAERRLRSAERHKSRLTHQAALRSYLNRRNAAFASGNYKAFTRSLIGKASSPELYAVRPSAGSSDLITNADEVKAVVLDFASSQSRSLRPALPDLAARLETEFPTVHPINTSIYDGLMDPIEASEVQTQLLSMQNDSAPGADEVHVLALKHCASTRMDILLLLLNACMNQQNVPDVWKTGIRVLIQKPGRDPLVLNNLRPITLSSVLSRLLSKILVCRLKKRMLSVLHPGQAGFLPGRSTDCVYQTVRHVLEDAKAVHMSRDAEQSLVFLVLVDLVKAYDAVEKWALLAALRRLKMPPAFINLVDAMHTNYRVRIRTSFGLSDSFVQERGVLQGDPLACLLFLIYFDVLICGVESLCTTDTSYANECAYVFRQFDGKRVPSVKAAALGYADDAVMLSMSERGCRAQLQVVRRFESLMAAEMSVPKTVIVTNSTSDAPILYNGSPLQVIRNKKAPFTVLGNQLTLSLNWSHQWSSLIRTINMWSRRVAGQKLSSDQIRYVINSIIMPSLLYRLSVGCATVLQLHELQAKLILVARVALRLPPHLCNDAFLSNPRHLGLGLHSLTVRTLCKLVRDCCVRLSDTTTVYGSSSVLRLQCFQKSIQCPGNPLAIPSLLYIPPKQESLSQRVAVALSYTGTAIQVPAWPEVYSPPSDPRGLNIGVSPPLALFTVSNVVTATRTNIGRLYSHAVTAQSQLDSFRRGRYTTPVAAAAATAVIDAINVLSPVNMATCQRASALLLRRDPILSRRAFGFDLRSDLSLSHPTIPEQTVWGHIATSFAGAPVIVYCHGRVTRGPPVCTAGYGWSCRSPDNAFFVNACGRVPGYQTLSRAALISIIDALQHVCDDAPVTILSDNKPAVQVSHLLATSRTFPWHSVRGMLTTADYFLLLELHHVLIGRRHQAMVAFHHVPPNADFPALRCAKIGSLRGCNATWFPTPVSLATRSLPCFLTFADGQLLETNFTHFCRRAGALNAYHRVCEHHSQGTSYRASSQLAPAPPPVPVLPEMIPSLFAHCRSIGCLYPGLISPLQIPLEMATAMMYTASIPRLQLRRLLCNHSLYSFAIQLTFQVLPTLSHMHHIDSVRYPSNLCPNGCQVPETTSHVMSVCPAYAAERAAMIAEVTALLSTSRQPLLAHVAPTVAGVVQCLCNPLSGLIPTPTVVVAVAGAPHRTRDDRRQECEILSSVSHALLLGARVMWNVSCSKRPNPA